MAGPIRIGTGGSVTRDGARIFTRTLFPGNVDPDYGILGVENAATSTWQQGSLASKVIRRRNTRRRLQEPLDVTSTPVVANTSRAVEPKFLTRVSASRKHRSVGWLAALAPTISVVVPVAAWLVPARPIKTVRESLKRRLIVVPDIKWQAADTLVAASLKIPKALSVTYKRKLLVSKILETYPQVPPTGPPPSAWQLVASRVVSQRRRLQRLEQPVYPATPQAPSNDRSLEAAFVTRQIKSRKFLKTQELNTYPATPALYPSFVQKGYNRRKNTHRRLLEALVAPVFTATPPPTLSPDRTLQESFVTRTSKSRRLLVAPPVLNVAAVPPPVTPAVYASLFRPKTIRRKPRQGLFLTGIGEIVAPAQPEAAWKQVNANRVEHKRKLLKVPVHLLFPQIPPTPPQPEPSFKRPRQFFKTQTRKRIEAPPQITYPPTPAPTNVMRVWIGAGTVTGIGTRVFIKG